MVKSSLSSLDVGTKQGWKVHADLLRLPRTPLDVSHLWVTAHTNPEDSAQPQSSQFPLSFLGTPFGSGALLFRRRKCVRLSLRVPAPAPNANFPLFVS